LGNLHYSAGHLEAAEIYYQQGLERMQRLAAANPSVTKFRGNIAIHQSNLGMLRFATGEFDDARRLFQDALSAMAVVAESDPQVTTYQGKLIGIYLALGELSHETGDVEAARRVYLTAHNVAARLASADPSSRHRHLLAKTFSCLGVIESDVGDYEAARHFYQKALALNPDSAETLVNMGSFERDIGLCQASARSFERAIAIWTQEPNQEGLAAAYLELGHLKRCTGLQAEARHAYGQALALREKLVHDAPAHFGFARDLAAIYVALGHLCLAEGQSKAALSWYEKATATRRAVLKRKPDNPVICNDLAWLLATCPEPGFRDTVQAVALARIAVDRSPGVGIFRRTLGIAQYRAGNWNGTIAALEKAIELHAPCRALDWFFLAMARCRLGDKDQARTWYTQATDWLEKSKSQDQDLRRFRIEAEDLLGITDARMPNGIDAFRKE
jgi:tetratricopeptide (TPR) repeat protein